MSTIIFIRYREQNGKEVSGYIDYRERLKTDNFDDIFCGKKDLIPRKTDLSCYNWTLQKMHSNDSTYYRVDANTKERLSFRNNTDRKIINVDLEFLEKHPNLDIKRTCIKIPVKEANPEESKQVTKTKIEKKSKNDPADNDPEREDKISYGYKQIVIFDYEARNR
jgi:hypothetical protein